MFECHWHPVQESCVQVTTMWLRMFQRINSSLKFFQGFVIQWAHNFRGHNCTVRVFSQCGTLPVDAWVLKFLQIQKKTFIWVRTLFWCVCVFFKNKHTNVTKRFICLLYIFINKEIQTTSYCTELLKLLPRILYIFQLCLSSVNAMELEGIMFCRHKNLTAACLHKNHDRNSHWFRPYHVMRKEIFQKYFWPVCSTVQLPLMSTLFHKTRHICLSHLCNSTVF